MNTERPGRAATPRTRAAVWAGIGLALAAFWAGVWVGIAQPLLDAWLNR